MRISDWSSDVCSSDLVLAYPPRLIPDPAVLDSWRKMFSDVPIERYLLNSVLVTGIIVVSQTICNVLAAYVFARIEFRGRDAIWLGRPSCRERVGQDV